MAVFCCKRKAPLIFLESLLVKERDLLRFFFAKVCFPSILFLKGIQIIFTQFHLKGEIRVFTMYLTFIISLFPLRTAIFLIYFFLIEG